MEPVSLYATCPLCEGHGRIAVQPGGPRTAECRKCRGKGQIATGDGAAIIELLKLTGLMDMAPDE